MKAIFLNIDNYIDLDRKIVFFNKNKPTNHILEIPYYEYALYKSGHYKSMNHKLLYNGHVYWLDDIVYDDIVKKIDIESVGITVEFKGFKINDDLYKICENYDEYYLYSFILSDSINSDIIEDIMKHFNKNYLNIKNLITFKPNLKSDMLTAQFERIILKTVYGIEYNKKAVVIESNSNDFFICDNNMFIKTLDFNSLISFMFKKLSNDDKKTFLTNLKMNNISYVIVDNNKYNRKLEIGKFAIDVPTNFIKTFESFLVDIKFVK